MSEHTPTPWKIRTHPANEDHFYIHAEMTEDHPYNGASSGIEIMSDEDYPRKRADAAPKKCTKYSVDVNKYRCNGTRRNGSFGGCYSLCCPLVNVDDHNYFDDKKMVEEIKDVISEAEK